MWASGQSGEVQGTVYDSVARRALAGAVVQVVKAADPSGGAFSTTTDENGRYVITGVPPGRYVAGFLHSAADSLALNRLTRAFDLAAGQRVRVDLAIPAPRTLVAVFCGRDGAADSTGALIGLVLDARTRGPLNRGTVSANWHEWVFERSTVDNQERSATAAVRPSGWYLLCGVPSNIDVAVRAWGGPDTTGIAEVSVGIAGLRRHDLLLGGVANVRGVVVSEKKVPLSGVRVSALGRDWTAITDSAGRFFARMPAGSQTLELRALGYAPERQPLHLRPDADTTVSVTLTSLKTVLDTIRIVATRVFDRDRSGFQKRMRIAAGYHFDHARIQRNRPFDLSTLLRSVPSLRVVGAGIDRTIEVRRGRFQCTPALWMDGMPLSSDLLGQVDFLVRPDELDGVEVYVGPETPYEFLRSGTCGAILLWTRRLPRTR